MKLSILMFIGKPFVTEEALEKQRLLGHHKSTILRLSSQDVVGQMYASMNFPSKSKRNSFAGGI